MVADSLDAFAALAAARNQPVRALRLAGAARALRDAVGASSAPASTAFLERLLRPARAALGVAAQEDEVARGRTMTPEHAVAYALSDGGAP
jgi:hypothetical protein